MSNDMVKHPAHYTQGRNFEPKDVIRDWELNFNLGSALKYIARAGRKDDIIQDLCKAREYLNFEISALETERGIAGSQAAKTGDKPKAEARKAEAFKRYAKRAYSFYDACAFMVQQALAEMEEFPKSIQGKVSLKIPLRRGERYAEVLDKVVEDLEMRRGK